MTISPYAFSISRLVKEPSKPLRFDCSGTISDIVITSNRIDDDEEIRIHGRVEAVHEGLLVSGVVETVWSGQCVRCLEVATGALVVPVRELFEHDADDESGSYGYDGEMVDLTSLANDAVVLELPQLPLCSEECLGLCSECGTNLNLGECGCDRTPLDPRWAALKEFSGGESSRDD